MRNFRTNRFWLLLFACVLASPSFSAPATVKDPRSILDLDHGWRFKFGAQDAASKPRFDDSDWEKVDVPHTWNEADGSDGGSDYKRGAGWYRLKFKAPASGKGRRSYLRFDAVSLVATVWLNGREVGTHFGGFSAFCFDVTGLLKPGASNLLAVKADSSWRDDVPPLEGDFTLFGGIIRDVSLVTASNLSVDLLDYASPGVALTPLENGLVGARIKIRNSTKTPLKPSVTFQILDAGGNLVAKQWADVPAPPGVSEASLEAKVSHPRLWNGRQDPYLYQAVVEVHSKGKLTDRVRQPLGFRTFQLDPAKGFLLNGQPCDLHGVNSHQDRVGRGRATLPEDRLEDMDLIHELGATFLRLAHYQHPPQTYDLCDKEGLVTWAENCLVNKVSENPAFAEHTVTQLRELIRQNYNHPSIFVWSVSNEVQTHKPPQAKELLNRLCQTAKEEDPSRPVVLATNYGEGPGTYGTDMIAHNFYAGWYWGTLREIPKWVEEQRRKYPKGGLGLSEYGAGGGPNTHSAKTVRMDHSEEYQALFHEAYWKALEGKPWIWCKVIWVMFDFASDWRKEGEHPGINDKGLVTRDRKVKKDVFYWYKAHWNPEPLVYITSRRFTPRVERNTAVKVYSNRAEVELSLNGKSLGKRKVKDCIALWEGVRLSPGENKLEASALSAGVAIADSCAWTVEEKVK